VTGKLLSVGVVRDGETNGRPFAGVADENGVSAEAWSHRSLHDGVLLIDGWGGRRARARFAFTSISVIDTAGRWPSVGESLADRDGRRSV
jgi:hypothetical protein